MEIATTTLISPIDLINLSRDLAQLNLGYLGISVAILGVLGGVFVYFNIKPLQEKLGKQEDTINDLKKEATSLLGQTEVQTRSSLKEFEEKQSLSSSVALGQLKDAISLEVTNKIQAAENSLVEKIDSTSDDKDSKLKEILLSEMSNKILSLEKSLTAVIEKYKKIDDERFLSLENKSENGFKEIERDILDLKAFKYDMEGKMGGIIFTIEALEKCLKDTPHLLKFKLNDLKDKIGKYTLSPDLFVRLQSALKAVSAIKDKDEDYAPIIKEIEELLTVQDKPKI